MTVLGVAAALCVVAVPGVRGLPRGGADPAQSTER